MINEFGQLLKEVKFLFGIIVGGIFQYLAKFVNDNKKKLAILLAFFVFVA